jgi:hypothetical protein
MIATLSQRATTELIRELEGISPEVSEDEILERMQSHYAPRLFKHVAEFGVVFDGRCNVRGSIADFGFTLRPSSTDNRETLVDGIALLRPAAITVEKEDLPALVLNPPMLAAMRDEWSEIANQFHKIMPSELLDAIESAARKVLNTPREFDPYINSMTGDPDLDFQVWAAQHGIKDPSRARVQRERAVAAEDKARADALQKQWDRLDPDQREDSSWGIREL